MIERISVLDEIEKDLTSTEKILLATQMNIAKIEESAEKILLGNQKTYSELQSFKEIENSLCALKNSSVSFLKHLAIKIGDSEGSEKINEYSSKPILVNIDTYETISSTIISSLAILQDLEAIKQQILADNKIVEEINNLETELSKQLHSSLKDKEDACSRMNRISRASSLPFQTSKIEKEAASHDHSFLNSLHLLRESILKILKTNSDQDKFILELSAKFVSFERHIDEIELRLDEMIAADIRDLYKCIPLADTATKSLLDQLQKSFIDFPADTTDNLFEHIESLERKIEMTPKIEQIRCPVRETQVSDIIKIKSDLNERINELTTSLSLVENEKKQVETAMASLNNNYEMTSSLAQKMIESCKEKDREIGQLKNSINTMQEQYQQISQEHTRAQDEIEELIKKNREYIKNIRAKETELAQLKENLENKN